VEHDVPVSSFVTGGEAALTAQGMPASGRCASLLATWPSVPGPPGSSPADVSGQDEVAQGDALVVAGGTTGTDPSWSGARPRSLHRPRSVQRYVINSV